MDPIDHTVRGCSVTRAGGLAAMAALLAIGGLIWGWKHRAGSVDMALHYALVEYISDHWAWPSPAVAHMGEMNQYPPVAHTLAAIVGALVGSSYLGLHLASTASLIVAYAGIFVLLRFDTPRATLMAAGLLAAILLALEHSHAFIGREMSENFFYPQLLGATCVVALVVLRARVELGVGAEIAGAVAATFLLGWVYPIAAVQLAGVAVAWRALLLARTWHAAHRLGAAALAPLPVLLVGLVAAIVLHPRFAVVAGLAANEGTVILRIPGVLVLPATALLAAAAGALAVACVRGRLALAAPVAFVALCAGVAAAAVAQAAAFYGLGIGSRYGVIKHIFPVCTLLAAAAVVGVINVIEARRAAGNASRAALARLVFVPATLVAVVASHLPWRGEALAPAMRTEAFLRALAHGRGADADGRTVLLAGSLIERFGFSMGVLHLPKDTTYDLLYRSTPALRRAAVAQGLRHAVVAVDAAPSCVVRADAAARLALVDYACYARAAGID